MCVYNVCIYVMCVFNVYTMFVCLCIHTICVIVYTIWLYTMCVLLYIYNVCIHTMQSVYTMCKIVYIYNVCIQCVYIRCVYTMFINVSRKSPGPVSDDMYRQLSSPLGVEL